MAFEVIASIDLLKGQVVRLERGDYKAATVFADDPVAMAQDWEGQGAPRLHVVDLDGASKRRADRTTSRSSGIIQRIAIPVQVAGGIRSIDAGDQWLATGADRVVFGTKALTDEAFLAEAVEHFGPQLVVAADCRNGEVRVAGWTEGTGEDVIDAAERLAAAGVPRLLVTDIAVDGMLDRTERRAATARSPTPPGSRSSLPAASRRIDDVIALARVPGVEGAIIGKALYVGAFDLGDAVKAVI